MSERPSSFSGYQSDAAYAQPQPMQQQPMYQQPMQQQPMQQQPMQQQPMYQQPMQQQPMQQQPMDQQPTYQQPMHQQQQTMYMQPLPPMKPKVSRETLELAAQEYRLPLFRMIALGSLVCPLIIIIMLWARFKTTWIMLGTIGLAAQTIWCLIICGFSAVAVLMKMRKKSLKWLLVFVVWWGIGLSASTMGTGYTCTAENAMSERKVFVMMIALRNGMAITAFDGSSPGKCLAFNNFMKPEKQEEYFRESYEEMVKDKDAKKALEKCFTDSKDYHDNVIQTSSYAVGVKPIKKKADDCIIQTFEKYSTAFPTNGFALTYGLIIAVLTITTFVCFLILFVAVSKFQKVEDGEVEYEPKK